MNEIKSVLITATAAAEYMGISPATLQYWRSMSTHKIPYIKVGGRVLYRISELEKWLESRTVIPD
jgi:excisionase family DNA binding protein